MKLSRRIALFVGIALAGACTTGVYAQIVAQTQKTEELQAGRWVQVDGAASQPSADPELLRVEELITSGQFSAASARAVEWLKVNKTSPLRDRALFLNAEALYRYGDRIKSFYYLDELMETYPDSPLFARALEKQYQIAESFLAGYKSRIFGIPLLTREEEGVEMLYRIQQRSPGSPLAERALLRTADHYYASEDYDLAGDAYGAYKSSYPRSPKIQEVKLRQAFSNLAQFRGVRFDATPVLDARAQLNDLLVTDPEFAEKERVPEILARIDNTFARKLYVTADFYNRTDEPVAAAYQYRFLTKTYPDSPEAADAKRRLAQMPPNVMDSVPPSAGVMGVPTSTQPSNPGN